MKKIICLAILIPFLSYSQVDYEKKHIIDYAFNTGHTLNTTSADLDGDGDLDIIYYKNFQYDYTGAQFELWWLENIDGQGNFSNHKVLSYNVIGNTLIFPIDIDNDNDIDLIFNDSSGLHWIENIDGQGTFSNRNLIDNTSTNNQSLFVKDLDGDNYVDIVSTSPSNQTLIWYKNLNSGNSFSSQQIISASLDGISSIYIEDIDSDGFNDIVVTSETLNSLFWYKNQDGLGNFGTEQIISTNLQEATSVYAKDLNNDTFIDLLVASKGDNTISWFENQNGIGDFGSKQIITNNAIDLISIVPIDINQDGHLDIISGVENENEVAWYLNNGLGNFGPKQLISSNNTPLRDIHANDLDNNGIVSILVTEGNYLTQFNYDNSETFLNKGKIYKNIKSITDVDFADINGDGFLDLVLSDDFLNKIIWVKNSDGQGNFCCQKTVSFNIDSVNSVKAIDIDNDNDLDLVATSPQDGEIIWFENLNGYGNFGSKQVLLSELGWVNDIKIIDVDLDGFKDLIIKSEVISLFWVKNLDGIGNFSNPITLTNDDYPSFALSYEMKDIDGDNDLDLFETYYYYDPYQSPSVTYDSVGWKENIDGQGNFGTRNTLIEYGENGSRSVILIDIDGDDDLDILRHQYTDNPVSWNSYNQAHSIIWYENTDGLGNFSSTENNIYFSNYAGLNRTFTVEIDIDNDYDSDILFISGTTRWLENEDGTGNFSAPQNFNSVGGTEKLIPIDLDQDGDVDLIDTKRFEGHIYWHENQYINTELSNSEVEFNQFKLYPNPSSYIITVKSINNINSLTIYNQQGQLIKKISNTNSIDVSNLSNGIYYIEIKDIIGKVKVKQFIKN